VHERLTWALCVQVGGGRQLPCLCSQSTSTGPSSSSHRGRQQRYTTASATHPQRRLLRHNDLYAHPIFAVGTERDTSQTMHTRFTTPTTRSPSPRTAAPGARVPRRDPRRVRPLPWEYFQHLLSQLNQRIGIAAGVPAPVLHQLAHKCRSRLRDRRTHPHRFLRNLLTAIPHGLQGVGMSHRHIKLAPRRYK